jgi:hypothetical protein
MTARWAHIPDPFLNKFSVNTFPLLDNRFLTTQQLYYNNGKGRFCVVRADMLQEGEKVREFSSIAEYSPDVNTEAGESPFVNIRYQETTC